MNLMFLSQSLTRKCFLPILSSSSSSQVKLFNPIHQSSFLNFGSTPRQFSSSPSSSFREYLRDVPRPSPERMAEIEKNMDSVKQFRNQADPKLTFDMFLPALRDPFLHKGAIIKMSRIALLLTKVETLEHLQEAIKFLKHLQRGGFEFGRHVSANFIRAAIKIDAGETILDLIHRSVLDRNNIDEEPLFRIFPAAPVYEDLISYFLKKNDIDNAIRAFSIGSAQLRDNPTSIQSWNQVYYLGMLCYWKKKAYGDVKLIHQQCLHLQLPELPQMLVLLARVEAIKKQPDLDFLTGLRAKLASIHKNHLWWAELTALIGYASNDPAVCLTVSPAYRASVLKFLKTFLEEDRLDKLFPSASE